MTYTRTTSMNFKNGLDKPDYDARALARLLSKTRMDESGCVIWYGANSGIRKNRPTDNVYGKIKYKNHNMTTHRLAWILKYGDISDDLVIDHICEKTLCVNTDHLELVTVTENNRRKFSRNT